MNPSGKFFNIIIELSKNKKFNSQFIYIYIYIYIYICFYLCRLHRETIEKQDVLSAVSCSLREMERHSNEPANEPTKKYQSLIT